MGHLLPAADGEGRGKPLLGGKEVKEVEICLFMQPRDRSVG